MTTHYTNEESLQLRHKSNRTFSRMVSSIPADVLDRYGYVPEQIAPLRLALDQAMCRDDWAEVQRISQELQRQERVG